MPANKGTTSSQSTYVSREKSNQPKDTGEPTIYSGSNLAIFVDIFIVVVVAAVVLWLSSDWATTIIVAIFVAIIILSSSIRIINQWNRMAVLRLGKYKGIIGPGFYTIVPIFDSTPFRVDTRVLSTTFSAEKTLTKDNVPVDVDAILFWQVKNPEKAVLNVQTYQDSVQLAAQTALRDIIGKAELSHMLAGRDIIGSDIQSLIEERISNWGIDAISVEIRDVTIPQELQNAMARVATSEREKMARVTLAESESLAADKMLEAAKKYQTNIYAMQLRSLNMMYEISLNGKNLMVFIPTESKGFSIPTPMGVIGLEDMSKSMKSSKKQFNQDKDKEKE